jgi:HK97 family phage prohead protease
MTDSFNFFVPFSKSPSFDANSGYYYLDGIASSTGVDRDTERMSEHALDSMVRSINAGQINLFMDHQHEWKNAIGLLESASKRDGRVHAKIRLERSDSPMSPVKYLLDKLSSGINLGLSVGGSVVKQHDEYDKAIGRKVGVIDDVELYEVSVVGIPSNPDCPVSMSKSFDEDGLKKNLGQMMKSDLKFRFGEGRHLEKSVDGVVLTGQSSPIGHNTTEANVCPECKALMGELLASKDGMNIYLCRGCGRQYQVDLMSKNNVSLGGANVPHATGAESYSVARGTAVSKQLSAEQAGNGGNLMVEKGAEAESSEAEEEKKKLKSEDKPMEEGCKKAEDEETEEEKKVRNAPRNDPAKWGATLRHDRGKEADVEEEKAEQNPAESAETAAGSESTLTPAFSTPSKAPLVLVPNVPSTERGLGTTQDVPVQNAVKNADLDLEKNISRIVDERVEKALKAIVSEKPSVVKALADNLGAETIEPEYTAAPFEKKMRFSR